MRTPPSPRRDQAIGAFAGLCVCAIGASFTSQARAYEDQLTVGAGAGYAWATDPGLPHHGINLQLELSLGLSSTWSARALATAAALPSSGARPAASRFTLGTELVYLVDVLEIVPYAGAGIDGLVSFASGTPEAAFGAHPVVGVDWLLSRTFLLGLSVRPVFVLTHFETQPVYLTAMVTASWLLEL